MAAIDPRPGRVQIQVRPGNAITANLVWPDTEDLTGRTFEATVIGEDITGSVAIPLAVAGQVMTVTFPASVTETLAVNKKYSWLLTETTSGDQVIITGRLPVSMSPTDSPNLTVQVGVSEITIDISVSGPQGPEGISAYDVAVLEGFTGTEAEWLTSLIGPVGPQGPVGPEGPVGPAGGVLALEHGTTIGETTYDGSALTVTVSTVWGIDADGFPYYLPDGAAAGEEAALVLGTDGSLNIVPIGG